MSSETKPKPKKRIARRTQEERSGETREKLLRATIEVLLARGYNGLSLAQVHAHAGLSSGARVHHYRTKADLVVAATAFAYEKATEAGRKRAASSRDSADPLAAFIADCRSIYFDWPFIVALELLVPGRTDPVMAAKITPIMEDYRRSMNEVWLAVFRDAGVPDDRAETILNLTLNVIRGMAINSLWQNDPALYDSLLADWRGVIGSVLELRPAAKTATHVRDGTRRRR